MKITVAIDSFKGCISSAEAGNAAAKGILRAFPSADVTVFPIADGGEGTVDALTEALGGRIVTARVTSPVGQKIFARYGIAGSTAIIEIAAAAGLALTPDAERNPMHTTTYGVGEMIRNAIDNGCRDFIIGLGGSATNDCGMGMLKALGFEFLDNDGSHVPFGAEGVIKTAFISCKNVLPKLSECSFKIACDVKNPLCGPSGCSAVFAPQKGALPQDIPVMDAAMARFAELTKQIFPQANAAAPGAGAAGGLGFAFMTYLGGSMHSGIKLIIDRTGIEESIASSDLVITGEGRLDAQTAMGKVPSGIAGLAKRHGKPVVALAGCIGDGADECLMQEIDAYFPILRSPMELKQAMDPKTAAENLAATAQQVMRLYLSAQEKRVF